jgi:hypothetical protein
MNKLGLDFDRATRDRDEALARITTVTSSAWRESAAAHMLAVLRERGPSSGELLVSACEAAGIRSSSAKHFGPVIQRLAREGKIVTVGVVQRAKGHRTMGARLWDLVRT